MFTQDVNPALNPLNTNSHYDSIVTSTKSQPDYNNNYLDETEISDKLKCYNAKHPSETFSIEMDLFAFVVTRKVHNYHITAMVFANLKSPAHFTYGKQKLRMVAIGTQTGQDNKNWME